MSSFCWISRAALLSSVTFAASAFAQEAPVAQATQDTANTNQTGGVDEIIVTARKRAENIQNVPASVSAMTPEQLERYDINNLEDIAVHSPSLNITRASNGAAGAVTIRGIGSTVTSSGIDQTVATVVDGVHFGHGRIIEEGFFDLGRVEILRGPQSLFFGKSSTAGVISITTADPTSKPEYIVKLGYEIEAKQLLGEVIASGPLSDTLGLRIALRGQNTSRGLFHNTADPVYARTFDVATGNTNFYLAPPAVRNGPGGNQILGRATIKWQPVPEFTATLKASYNLSHNDNPSGNYVIFDCGPGGLSFSPKTACTRDFKVAQNNFPAEFALELGTNNGELFNRWESYGATLTLGYEADKFNIQSVTNYNENTNEYMIDGDYFSANTQNTFTYNNDARSSISTELRALSTLEGPLNFLAGVFFQRSKFEIGPYRAHIASAENSDAPPTLRFTALTKDSNTLNKTYAAYGQVIWKAIPQVEVTGGARYTHETKDSYFNQPYINPTLQGIWPENQPFTADQSFNNFSPEVTLSWKPQNDLLIYAAYKTGYKSGGFSNSGILSVFGSPQDFLFGPEKAKGFEGGVKATLFDRQLRLNAGIYHYKFNDLQVDFFNSTTISFVTTNAGSAVSKGFEIEGQFAPRALKGLSLNATLNYNKSRYVDYIAPCVAGQKPSEGCTLIARGVPSQQLAGKPTSNAPLWTGSLAANYVTPINDRFDLDLSAAALYSDDFLASPFANAVARQPSFVTVNGAIRIKTNDDRWDFALIGQNLTNRFVIRNTHDVVGTGSGTGTEAGVRALLVGQASNPRTIQLQATFRF